MQCHTTCFLPTGVYDYLQFKESAFVGNASKILLLHLHDGSCNRNKTEVVVLTPSRRRYHDPTLQGCALPPLPQLWSSLVVVITNDLLAGDTLARFTTPCEPGFIVTRNLYFVWSSSLKKMELFLLDDFWVFADVTCIDNTKGEVRGLNASQKCFRTSLANPTLTQKKKL